MVTILALRLRCASTNQIIDYCQKQLGFGKQRALALMARALEQIQKASEQDSVFTRTEQKHRIRSRIRELITPRLKPDGVTEIPIKLGAYQAVARFEELLADIEGNREPIEVKVTATVHASAVNVLVDMSEETRLALYERAKERRRLAELAVTGNPGSRSPLLAAATRLNGTG
jgi:hypothetical protein